MGQRYEGRVPADLRPEILQQHGPVDDRHGILGDAVVPDVADHADDLPPAARRRPRSDPLADGRGRIAPVLAGEVLRDQYRSGSIVDIRPG